MPVALEIYPVTFYDDPSGDGWEAALVVDGFGEKTCGHHHFDTDEAWKCGEGFALAFARWRAEGQQ